ncbi:MAG: hypothetical protein KDA80_06075, partial [Planctomycetaceae bacterium]|nr:hypothetical protein [Planctomycetaceae bacterium]
MRPPRTVAIPVTDNEKARVKDRIQRELATWTVQDEIRPLLRISGPGTDRNWLLFNSLPVDHDQDVLRIIDLDVARWPIEVFFRVLKTGCKVEEIQLEKKARLKRALMFYQVIAWRILYVTFLGRECPDLPCDVVFSEAEWKSVWKIVEQDDPPKAAPPLEE